ncbi:MAG: TonB-dependent receptor [Candidatus Eisenbacteria bacterium]|nr:TonB-dependent receptor [Candidatus Eisenbacteria bacterium]
MPASWWRAMWNVGAGGQRGGCAAAAVVALLAWCQAGSAAAPSSADLADLSLEELMDVRVVVAASRHAEDARTAPSSVSVITAEDIRRFGYRTLGDALASVRGLYTAYDRNYQYVGVRGILRPGDYGSRVLVLVDGFRVNDPVYNQGPVGGEFPVDTALVERIEVVHGPGSSLYGTNALLAVVNVVTKAGDARGADVSAEVASGGTAGGRVTFSRPGRTSVLVSGSLSDSDGRTLHFHELDDPASNSGYSSNDHERSGSAFARATHGPLTVQAIYSSREKGIPTGAWGMVLDDERNRSLDEMAFVDLEWQRGVPETLSVLARVQHGAYSYEGDYVFDDGEYLNHDRTEGRWLGGEALVIRRFGTRHLVSLGGEYRDNLRLDQLNFDGDGTSYLESLESSRFWGLYLQDEFGLSDALTLHAGLRYDDYDTFGGDWSPRLSLVWSPTTRTVAKLIYGGAFRAPSPYELYYHDGMQTQKPNPDLGPESVTSYEAVVEHRIGGTSQLTVSVFAMEFDGLIGLATDPTDSLLVYLNTDRAQSAGFEVELEQRFVRGCWGRASYSYQTARDGATGERLSGSPQHLAKVHVTRPFAHDRFIGALEVQYVGDRPTVRGGTADACVVVNADLLAGSDDGAWTLAASVDDVFDRKRQDPASEEHVQDVIEQDGRTLRIELSRRF